MPMLVCTSRHWVSSANITRTRHRQFLGILFITPSMMPRSNLDNCETIVTTRFSRSKTHLQVTRQKNHNIGIIFNFNILRIDRSHRPSTFFVLFQSFATTQCESIVHAKLHTCLLLWRGHEKDVRRLYDILWLQKPQQIQLRSRLVRGWILDPIWWYVLDYSKPDLPLTLNMWIVYNVHTVSLEGKQRKIEYEFFPLFDDYAYYRLPVSYTTTQTASLTWCCLVQGWKPATIDALLVAQRWLRSHAEQDFLVGDTQRHHHCIWCKYRRTWLARNSIIDRRWRSTSATLVWLMSSTRQFKLTYWVACSSC